MKTDSMKQRMRHLSRQLLQSVMVVMMMCGMNTAWADWKDTDNNVTWTYVSGSTVYNGTEAPANVIDGNTGTKFCGNSTTCWVIVEASSPINLTGYSLYTANDTETNSGRNPRSWTIEGSNDDGASWTTLVNESGNTTMGATNEKEYEFTCTTQGYYTRFRLTINSIESGNIFQFSEFHPKGNLNPAAPTVTSYTGYVFITNETNGYFLNSSSNNTAKASLTFYEDTCVWTAYAKSNSTTSTSLSNDRTCLLRLGTNSIWLRGSSRDNTGTVLTGDDLALNRGQWYSVEKYLYYNNTNKRVYRQNNGYGVLWANSDQSRMFGVYDSFTKTSEVFTLAEIAGIDEKVSSTGSYNLSSAASYTPSFYTFSGGPTNYVTRYYAAGYTTGAESNKNNITTKTSGFYSDTWSLSPTVAGLSIDNSGHLNYTTQVSTNTNVTITHTVTENGSTKSVSKTVLFEANPTNLSLTSSSSLTVYVGNSSSPITYSLTQEPCHNEVAFTSSNTGVATVDANGVVMGVSTGTASIVVTAYKTDGSTNAALTTTCTVTVKDKVATPTITFNQNPGATTATATVDCATPNAVVYYTTDGTDPNTLTTTYSSILPITVNNVADGTTIKAIAVMPSNATNYTYYDNSEVAEATYNSVKVPTPEIIIRGTEVTFSCDLQDVTFYYTYGTNPADPTTSSSSWTIGSNAITTIPANNVIKVIATKQGYSPSEVATATMRTANVVYLNFGARTNGNGTKNSPVNNWASAFAKLGYGPNAKYLRSQWSANGLTELSNHSAFSGLTDADFTSTVDNNIIYLLGEVSVANFEELMQKTPEGPTSESELMNKNGRSVIGSGYFKPVTISGKKASGRSVVIKVQGGQNGRTYTLNEDMRFENVEFYNSNGNSQVNFILGYYDLEMGDSIITTNFYDTKSFSTYHHGYKQGETSTAHILFYGGYCVDKRFGTSPNGALNFDYFLPHPDGYKITVRSGFFSTISPGGMQYGNKNLLNGTMGSPNTPVKCTITIDIDHAWNDAHTSGVLESGTTPNCDIAVVIAGTHEGNMYGDVDIIVKSGKVDRVVNGTFGANNFVDNHPADSYFGRAHTLIDPREPSTAERDTGYTTKNSMVVIRELFGGGLGRFKSDSDKGNQSSTYFYGQSSVVINGGTFETAIYAAGAGGVNGVGDSNHYTPDTKLPYWTGTGNNTIAYGTYADFMYGRATKPFVVTCRNADGTTTDVDLYNTSAKIEIHGGVFGTEETNASIYGGGYGYVDSELINTGNGCKPNTRAGAIFAAAGQQASSITIDGDAKIYGNVYGAGRGASQYKTANITYNGDNYTQLGQVYGNTSVTIGGNAEIHGNVYGAGQGIDEANFADMARLYGNTSLTIKDNATINGSVYGGGANGATDGTATVSILGGTISGDVYGGGALANTGNATVDLTKGAVSGSVYGGGLGRTTGRAVAATVGTATVNVGKSDRSSGVKIGGSVFGCNNLNGTPTGNAVVNVYRTVAKGTETTENTENPYHVAGVYGGGNQAAYSPTSGDYTTKVTIYGCDNSIKDLYGGGNAASVPGTDVLVNGGRFDRIFAGGNGESGTAAHVGFLANGTTAYTNGTGDATLVIKSGTINQVFGGSNSAGLIRGNSSVTISHENNDCENFSIEEIYGGGNRAPGKAARLTIGCIGTDKVKNVYGGANAADISNSIELNITGGKYENIFGGNNTGGTISGNVTVNITGGQINNVFGENNAGGNVLGKVTVNINMNGTDACGNTSSLDYVYGGGKDAQYTPTTVGAYPEVNLIKGVVNHDVFGGGFGERATVTSNPKVTMNPTAKANFTINGNIYGGGNAAPVVGSTTLIINNGTIGTTTSGGYVFGGGLGSTAKVQNNPDVRNSGNTSVTVKGNTDVKQNVYGGGNGGEVEGDTQVTIGE